MKTEEINHIQYLLYYHYLHSAESWRNFEGFFKYHLYCRSVNALAFIQ